MGDRHPMAREIAHMAEQEERHRRFFDAMIAKRGVRPTALQPLWNVAGFALGAVTAAMGPRAAMACTAAVETEIDRPYRSEEHTSELPSLMRIPYAVFCLKKKKISNNKTKKA